MKENKNRRPVARVSESQREKGWRWGDFISQHRRSSETKETLRSIQSDSFILEMRKQGSQRSRLCPREPAPLCQSKDKIQTTCLPARCRLREGQADLVVQFRVWRQHQCLASSSSLGGIQEISKWPFSPHPKRMTCPLTQRFMGAPCIPMPFFWQSWKEKCSPNEGLPPLRKFNS